MEPNLLIGDHLFGCCFFYGIKIPFTDKRVLRIRKPHRGDIVIFRYPYERKNFVKRCVAVGGDIIEIKDKKVYINGHLLNEPYAKFRDPMIYPNLDMNKSEYQRIWEKSGFKRAGGRIRDNFGPAKIPSNSFFMMGDNRDYSFDSRFWGPLKEKYILGKFLILYFSWDSKPPLYKIWQKVRWKRIGQVVK